jgi:hypothetical protein
MRPKAYEALAHVNYDCANGIVTRNTVAFDFASYHAALARLHHLCLHDWGVAGGLEVGGTVGAADLQVKPGVAIDRKGQLVVLATGGNGLLGLAHPDPNHPAAVPVTLPTAGLAAQKYLLTIQYFERRNDATSHPDFVCGQNAVAPWLRLQPVAGFADSDDFVCLAVVELGAGGLVKSLHARDAAVPFGRRRLGETVGAVHFEAPTDGAAAGAVEERSTGAIAPLSGAEGLEVRARLTALTGELSTQGNVNGRDIARDGTLLDALAKRVEELEKRLRTVEGATDRVPLGAMIPYFGAGKKPPKGYVFADGQSEWPRADWVPERLRGRTVPVMSGELLGGAETEADLAELWTKGQMSFTISGANFSLPEGQTVGQTVKDNVFIWRPGPERPGALKTPGADAQITIESVASNYIRYSGAVQGQRAVTVDLRDKGTNPRHVMCRWIIRME